MSHVTRGASRRVGWSYDELVGPMCGFGAAAGALGGALVGYWYGRDQALTTAAVPWYAVAGFLIGVTVGFFLALVPTGVLVALRHQTWATAPVRIALAALAGGAPLAAWQLLISGFALRAEVVVFCVMVTGAPAGLAAGLLACRTRRSLAG